ncbi:DUF5309 family protein [Vibrio mediterranei]|uniref:SU10 major capsid protein n=1 Tax=Vibrio mediterranei TaxID=689 RepID=UPI0017933780|nr:DUF5309 family protein [Vibrio mediterranei]NUW71414.1 DUF5309 family protein [Vibrio mediterranei]
MAASTTIDSYNVVGDMEDIEDVVYNIAPTRTPMLSMLQRTSCHNTLVEWQEDSLADADADNAADEGADAKDADESPTDMKNNRTQIFTKTVKVSGTIRAVDEYGRNDEFVYQSEKKIKELKRDIEKAVIGRRQAPVAGAGTASSGGKTRKLGSFFNYVHADNTVTAAAAGTFVEAELMSTLEKTYDSGGEPNKLLINTTHAKTIAAMATASGRQRDFGTGTALVTYIDLLVTPYGELDVVIDRFQMVEEIAAIDPEMAKIRVLRATNVEPLAKTGDSDKAQLLTELTLQVNNGKAHGTYKVGKKP